MRLKCYILNRKNLNLNFIWWTCRKAFLEINLCSSFLVLQQRDSSHGGESRRVDHQFDKNRTIPRRLLQQAVTTKSSRSSEAALHGLEGKQSTAVVAVEDPGLQTECSSSERSEPKETNNTVTHRLPPDFDPGVFRGLPEEIQKELLSPSYVDSLPGSSTSEPHSTTGSFTDSPNTEAIKGAVNELDLTHRAATVNHQRPPSTSALPGEYVMEESRLSFPRSPDCEFPGNVDPEVFSQLPPDVQKELRSDWKQKKPVLKMPVSKLPSSRKPGRSQMTKDRKAAGKRSQSNSLLKYFKPGWMREKILKEKKCFLLLSCFHVLHTE